MHLEPEMNRMWLRDESRSHVSTLDQLKVIYARLDYESTMFGERSPSITLGYPRDEIGPSSQVPSSFMNVAEARKSLDILSNAVYCLRSELLHLAALEMGNDIYEDWAVRYCIAYSRIRTVDLSKHASLLQQQSCLKFSLERWAFSFKVLSGNLEPRPAILLEMRHFYIYFLICTIRDTHEDSCDHFDPLFQRVADLGNEFVNANGSKSATRPKLTFTLESGIIPSLYLVAMKCRNYKIRHEAIALLDRTRCQEGMWEAGLIARFVAEVADLEEEAADTQGREDYSFNTCIPESARFSDVVIAMSETPGHGRLVCARYAHESTGEVKFSERAFQL
ncbi:uncharacterized protein N7458_001834 [Penicillium daleae]|uniref:Uncharacterized protein n=1 Tax=Penicillium daleae TaxID=63821 RepID=A0AAD6G6K8_9EURO|nr:uncharacterized protein N7458_001834 [Penicillium daleae]KAJ5460282.1 hypothetical protein N7458_001834 [Penicillium daleae]